MKKLKKSKLCKHKKTYYNTAINKIVCLTCNKVLPII